MGYKEHGGGSVAAWLGGIAVGALAMYVFDPERGRRRRALARDKAIHAAHVAGDRLGAKSRDLSNRAKGFVAETRSSLQHASETETGASDDGQRERSRANRETL
jgi:hypothetical protein